MLQRREIKQVTRSIGRIYRNKPELSIPLLGQLKDSLNLKGEATLTTVYLNQYLHSDGRIPIIVFWNGTTDKNIINKLNLNIKKLLNITAYSDNNDNHFNLKLMELTGTVNSYLNTLNMESSFGREDIGLSYHKGVPTRLNLEIVARRIETGSIISRNIETRISTCSRKITTATTTTPKDRMIYKLEYDVTGCWEEDRRSVMTSL
ncbi:hypothetical protein ACI65C_013592 [Semiaphis heraclei]